MPGLRTYEGSVAIVMGAASGIGKAIALELARRGCEVMVADIDVAESDAVVAAIHVSGGRASASVLDVTDYSAVKALVDRMMADRGRLDYLFNNAGIAVTGDATEYTLESWRRIVEVNFMGVVHGVHAAYPAMIQQGFGINGVRHHFPAILLAPSTRESHACIDSPILSKSTQSCPNG